MRRLHDRLDTPAATPSVGQAPQSARATELSGAVLRANVERLFGSPLYRPPMLPAAALKVLRHSKNPDVAYADVVSIVESDPLFAASVLRIASAPIYASKAAIRSIDQALLRLGLARLVDVCLEVAVTGRVFRAPGFDTLMERTRKHSIAVAYIARLVAERSGKPTEDTFTIGLLHELGLVAGFIALSTPALWPEGAPRSDVARVVFAERVALTERLVKAWLLPESIARALCELHRDAFPHDVSLATIHLADRIACSIGFEGAVTPTQDTDAYEHVREIIGLRRLDLSDLEAAAKTLCARIA